MRISLLAFAAASLLFGSSAVQAQANPVGEMGGEANTAFTEAMAAAQRCDKAALAAQVQNLKNLAAKALNTAKAAKAMGEFADSSSVVQMFNLADHIDSLAAVARTLPLQNCAQVGGTTSALPPLEQRILDLHNTERASVGASPLKWNEELAQHANEFAQQLATAHQLVHAPREGRGIERENLQKTLIGWSPDRMLSDWLSEKRNFVPGYYPTVARAGNWMSFSHYTQIIWPTTTDLGCGYAEGGGFGWLVCRYSPGGNKPGKQVGNYGYVGANVGFDNGGFRIETQTVSRPKKQHPPR